ncbi:MAG: hypothetical protein A49_11770 [Methyloceanibacter sp.]|nr:MAG: hypothetical protein A49_11770 [Methyloceanibacter sp.]
MYEGVGQCLKLIRSLGGAIETTFPGDEETSQVSRTDFIRRFREERIERTVRGPRSSKISKYLFTSDPREGTQQKGGGGGLKDGRCVDQKKFMCKAGESDAQHCLSE